MNNPDKIVFVGEALVGNEAVDQLVKFDRSLKDFSKRGIDGILLTKFDTIVSGCHKTTSTDDAGRQSWRSTVHDLCHWTTDLIRGMWSDLYRSETFTGRSHSPSFAELMNYTINVLSTRMVSSSIFS